VTRGIYFSLSAFVPEVFDIYMGNSIAYLTKLTGKPLSSHVEAYTYFGVLPVLLVIWICLKGPKNRIKFWIGSLFVTSLWFLCVPPVNDIAHILSFPLLHVIIPKMMIPIPFCVLVGYAGKYLQENTLHFDRSVPRLMIAIIGFLVFGILSYITLTRENVLQVTRALMMISLMLIFILFYLHHRKSDRIRKGSLLLPFVSIGISLVGIIHARGNIFNIGILYLSWSLLGISFLWIALDIWRRPRFPKIIFFSGVLLAGLVVFLVEYYAPSVFLQYLGAYDTIPLIILGLWKFVLIVSFLIFLLDDKTAPFPKRKNLLSLFVVVVLLDLLAYNKAYIHIVVQKPFAKEEIAYPPADSVLKNIDAKNYRVNRPHVFLGLSADSQAANMFTRYDVRSYGGVDSDVPPRHYEFIRNFDPHLIQINGVSPVSRNDRFWIFWAAPMT